MAMTMARRKEIELNNREREQRIEELENVYQDVAGAIKRKDTLHVFDESYPQLIFKSEITGKKYEVIIKEVK